MRFSNRLSDLGLRRAADGRPYWRDLTVQADSDPKERTIILAVDPNRLAFPDLSPESEGSLSGRPSFFDLVGVMAGDLVASARAKELYSLVQESADISRRITLSAANYPKASDELYAFMGFFERDFRYFDFYLGMYDAWVQLRRIASNGRVLAPVLEKFEARLDSDWSSLACLIGWYEPDLAEYRSACAGPDKANFRALIQVSLDKVHDYCRKLDPAEARATTNHPRCLEALTGPAPCGGHGRTQHQR